eukprot:g32031.t1
MATWHLALAISVGLAPSVRSLCLRDGLAESKRLYLKDSAGEENPISLIQYDWASADAATMLAEILIPEVLGYHVVKDTQATVSIFEGVLKLAGCSSANCSEFEENHAARAPEDLGSMGYNGDHYLFVKGSIRDQAYSDAGLALDFYKSYNTTFHFPQKYFDRLESFDRRHFFRCDLEGLDSTCIPLLAAGNGWIVDAMMQWSAAYGFPVAIGIAKDWGTFVATVWSTKALFYWWMPDATFLPLDPSYIVLPPHSPSEWAQDREDEDGIQTGNYITKLVSPILRTAAPSVRQFLQNFKLELGDMTQLLSEAANGRRWWMTSAKPIAVSHVLQEVIKIPRARPPVPFASPGRGMTACDQCGNDTMWTTSRSLLEEPGMVYKCFGQPERCPGGPPGICAAGRDPTSIGCSQCLDQLQPKGGECQACTGGDYLLLVVFGSMVIISTGGLHVLLVISDQSNGNQRSALFTAALSIGSLASGGAGHRVVEIEGPFRCNLHPNGLRTLQDSHSVLCDFSGSHLSLCLIGGVVCLLPLILHCTRGEKGDGACSFLVMRFNPGQEIFTVLFLLRNVLIVMAPLLPSASGSLFLMAFLLVVSFGSVAYCKPWRSVLGTQVDMVVHMALLLILQMGALAVTDVQEQVTMIICTACAACMIELLHRGPSFTAFLDSDNLTDLTQLFAYVSHDVKTLVVLGSSRILTRKWCMGEMVVARLEKVDTVLLSFPGFELPDEQFIQRYQKLIPDIGDFASYGFGMLEVKDTLHWLSTVKTLPMFEDFSWDGLNYIINQLTNTYVKLPVSSEKTDCYILADPVNMEAISTGYILAKLITPMIMGSRDTGPVWPVCVILFLQESLPVVLSSSSHHLPHAGHGQDKMHVILVCTGGCLSSPQLAQWIMQVRFMANCFVAPVISDDYFQIPSPLNIRQLIGQPSLQHLDRSAYAHVLNAIFLEIALPFMPGSASADDLTVRATQIMSRLEPGASTTLSSRLVMVQAEMGEGLWSGIESSEEPDEDSVSNNARGSWTLTPGRYPSEIVDTEPAQLQEYLNMLNSEPWMLIWDESPMELAMRL